MSASGARVVAALLLVLLAGPASGHLSEPTRSLRRLVADAHWAGRVRISDAHSRVRVEGRLTRPVVHARVLETLKGAAPRGSVLRFAQHGHGTAEFHDGEDVLLFLQPIARHGELGRTPLVTALRWVSLQEHDARWPVAGPEGEAVLAAARAHAAVATLPVADRGDALGRITLGLATSRFPRLANDAIRDLVRVPHLPIPAGDQAAVLLGVVDDRTRDSAQRAALLALLERRSLVPDARRWLDLLEATRGRDREIVIQRATPSVSRRPELFAALVALLAGDDLRSAAAAALAIATRGDDAAVSPLRSALNSPETRLRGAAVRALGRIGTPAARTALLAAADSHPEADTRRLAGATAARLAAP